MKFIKKEKPLTYLWILPILLLLDVVVIGGSFLFDILIYSPAIGMAASPVPYFGVLFTIVMGAITALGVAYMLYKMVAAYIDLKDQ